MPHGGQHPTEETMNITRKFLGGELGTPGQVPGGDQASSILPQQQTGLPGRAAPVAGQRAFGRQGALRRRVPAARPAAPGVSLSNRFLDLPGPVSFAQTPQGQAILQRILGGGRRRF